MYLCNFIEFELGRSSLYYACSFLFYSKKKRTKRKCRPLSNCSAGQRVSSTLLSTVLLSDMALVFDLLLAAMKFRKAVRAWIYICCDNWVYGRKRLHQRLNSIIRNKHSLTHDIRWCEFGLIVNWVALHVLPALVGLLKGYTKFNVFRKSLILLYTYSSSSRVMQ